MNGVGLFDGFAGFLNHDEKHAAEALRSGLIVPDTNVLLTLYKYSPSTREDMVRALESAGDRLFIPHQVMVEFWRNRRRVVTEHRDSIRKIQEALRKVPSQVSQEIDRYRRITRDDNKEFDERVAQLTADAEELLGLMEGALGHVVDPSAPTAEDPVLAILEALADGRVQARPDSQQWEVLCQEGARRVKEQIPPGYLDADKSNGDYAAGDYLLWHAAMTEAVERQCPLVIITADVKEDWWERSRETVLGARPEMVHEFQAAGGSDLVLMQPTTFLRIAREALSVDVADKSIQDADVAVEGFEEGDEYPAWTPDAVRELVARLDNEGAWQAEVIRSAATKGGVLTRKAIYRIAGRDPSAKLTGWTKPMHRITRDLQDEGYTEADVYSLMTVYWDGGSLHSIELDPMVVETVLAMSESYEE